MWQIGVWEQNEGLARLVRALAGPEQARVRAGSHPALLAGGPLELLVVSPTAVGWAGASVLCCRTVLLPDTAGALARSLLARRVVSYGMSPRDSLTLSSLEGDRVCVAVQRELIRPDGGVVERQELVLPREGERSAGLLLVRAGIRLLLGPPPEG